MASHISRNSRTKRAPIKKKASEASIFSNLTQISKSSSGSNSTVTPESMARDKLRQSKQAAPRKVSATRHSNRRNSTRQSPTMPPVEERPSVFAYMVDDEDVGNQDTTTAELEGTNTTQGSLLETASQASSSSEDLPHLAKALGPQEDRYQQWDYGSLPSGGFFSDSGISVRSSSPERESPIVRNKTQNNRTAHSESKEARADVPRTKSSNRVLSPRILEPFDGTPDISPEAFYSLPPRSHFQHSEYDPSEDHLPFHRSLDHRGEAPETEPHATTDPAKREYDLLASNISSDGLAPLRPIYRKFESLNNRALLHLQDEISKLEIRLEQVDIAIADGGNVADSKEVSKLMDDHDPPTPLQWQRVELITQILAKLDQYNRALSSYSSLSRHLSAASIVDVDIYKHWLRKVSPSRDGAMSHIIRREDLVTIPAHQDNGAPNSERSAIATGSAVLMTIIAFKFTPGFFSRAIIGTIIGGAVCCSGASSFPSDAAHLRECGRRAAVYGSIIMILAVAVG